MIVVNRTSPVLSSCCKRRAVSQAHFVRLVAGANGKGKSLSTGRQGNGFFTGISQENVSGGNGGGSGGNMGGSSGGGSSSGGGNDHGAPHPMQMWSFAFAALLAAGGAFAFVKKGSVKSLGASLSASLILALCARSMVGAGALGAARVAFGITLLLGIAMVNRFTSTKKIMPAGLVAGSSLLMSVGFLVTGL